MKRRRYQHRIALVYDRVNKWGGAERVLLTLHEIFPDAVLYTSLYNPNSAKWARVFDVHPSLINRIKILRTKHEWLALFMPIVFESHDFSNYDLVISVTSESAKGVLTGVNTKHICLCLTPTRYLWSHERVYFDGLFKRSIGKIFIKYLRWWDYASAQRPDLMIGISTEVCERIKKYYGRKAVLIFPPSYLYHKKLLLGGPPPLAGSASRRFLDTNNNYYLIVSRLVNYKRVDLVIEAFNELGLNLIIIGKGKEEKKLKRMAKNNITFIKDVTDVELFEYYSKAKALIAAQEEDFGLTMVEAMACGTPVIAYNKGGSKDIVAENINGILFYSQTKTDIIKALEKFEKKKFVKDDIIKSTKRFSKEQFIKKIIKIVND